jgi:hypothetical protein
VRQNAPPSTGWGEAECRSFREWRRPKNSYLFYFQRYESFDELVTQVHPLESVGEIGG